jgi:hypothetical protein
LRYDVDTNFCTTNNPQPVWSYNTFGAGYYYINSNYSAYYYVSPSTHTDFTNQVTTVDPTSCAGTTTTTTTTVAPTTTTTTTPAPTTTTSTTTATPTTTTTTTAALGCTTWTFSNSSPDFGNYVTYFDCDNVEQSAYVPELTAPQYCVKIGTTPVPGDTYITVTDTLDPCI